jgi:hypothetical protein
MEVHHHPELPHGEKKRFKEYVLEFLMIFLAVTMGFIAENIREHFSDASKEGEYIAGMVKNLAVDTTRLKETIKEIVVQNNGLDSLRKVSKGKLSQIPVQDSLYLFTARYLFYANNFKEDDITLTQLRNAGGYRLIRNEHVPDSIAEYESRVKDLNDEASDLFTSIVTARDRADAIFDLNIGHNFRLHPTSTPVLITTDKEKIYNYYNGCWEVLVGLNGYQNMLENHLKYTRHLIIFLKKEYDID